MKRLETIAGTVPGPLTAEERAISPRFPGDRASGRTGKTRLEAKPGTVVEARDFRFSVWRSRGEGTIPGHLDDHLRSA